MTISIHALRVEGDSRRASIGQRVVISIHALRVEGDACKLAKVLSIRPISIHALRVEGDFF